MKRLILGILVISYPLLLAGQMFPLSDQYVSNPLPVNPAFAGCHDALSAAVSFRNQWIGFSDAPRNYMLSVHTPVWHDKIGLGLMIDKYSVGIFRETSIIGNYAYRIRLSDGKLALGLGFGLISYKSAWNELQATDPNDIQLPDNAATGLVPSFSLGTYYYTRKYFIGFSVPYFLNYDVDQKSGTFKVSNFFSVANYCLTGGYEFEITRNVKLIPSFFLKYHHNTRIQIDYNAQINLKDRIWLGIGYRSKDMLVAMFRCQVNYQLNLAYSYDFNLGMIGKYENGSHEIGINYIFKYARNVMGPRHF